MSANRPPSERPFFRIALSERRPPLTTSASNPRDSSECASADPDASDTFRRNYEGQSRHSLLEASRSNPERRVCAEPIDKGLAKLRVELVRGLAGTGDKHCVPTALEANLLQAAAEADGDFGNRWRAAGGAQTGGRDGRRAEQCQGGFGSAHGLEGRRDLRCRLGSVCWTLGEKRGDQVGQRWRENRIDGRAIERGVAVGLR